MITALQMLDNPYRDIPLLTVLMSDLFGFSPERIAKIRLLDRQGPFYSALQKSAHQGDEASGAFCANPSNCAGRQSACRWLAC